MFGLECKLSGIYGKPSNSQARILSHWKDWLPERVVTGAVSYKDGRFIYAPGVLLELQAVLHLACPTPGTCSMT